MTHSQSGFNSDLNHMFRVQVRKSRKGSLLTV